MTTTAAMNVAPNGPINAVIAFSAMRVSPAISGRLSENTYPTLTAR